MPIKRLTLIFLLCLIANGCATIKLTEEGEKTRVLDPSEVGSCRMLGETTVTTLAKALFMDRPIEALNKELRTMARNKASKMGGDTIVPLTIIEQGEQSFVVYKCIDPGN